MGRAKGLPFKLVTVGATKGGVGKSSIAAALVDDLHRRGLKVGLLDADIDSPFIVELLGVEGKVDLDQNRVMVPARWNGIPVMSFALYHPDQFSGASMQGSQHEQWIRDALLETDWGGIDILVADLPAGSSDEFLTVRRLAGDQFVGMIVVGLSNLATSLQRTYNTASYNHIRILGCVENMAGPVFGHGGVAAFCEKNKLQYFGSIPLDPQISTNHRNQHVALPADIAHPIRNASSAVAQAAGLQQVAR